MGIRLPRFGSATHAPGRANTTEPVALVPVTARADLSAPPVATDSWGARMRYRLRALRRVDSDLPAQEGDPTSRADIISVVAALQGTQRNELEIHLKNRSVKTISTSSETSWVGILGALKRSTMWGTGLSLLAALLLHSLMPVWVTVATSIAIFTMFSIVLPIAAYLIAKAHRTVQPP